MISALATNRWQFSMPQLRLENSLVDDRYEVRERLSLGSYAEIFVGRDRRRNGEEVVIKALNAHLQGTPDADLERTLIENFQNEAMALDAVRHPHVILRLGHGTAADLNGVPFHYLALEYMAGGDLLKLCRTHGNSALDFPTTLFYFKQACEALAYAHSKGVIHRDLKPNNFLLTKDRLTLKVADFGVAKMTSEEAAEITRVGADIYAPPEHHPDESHSHVGRLTASADIYSLAKSFYTVVGGRTPAQFVRRPITSLPENVASQPWAESLLAVLRRATADTPPARYATVVEFWSELASAATKLPSVVAAKIPVEEDDATRVRSKPAPEVVSEKLAVAPTNLPAKPAQPEFSSLLPNAEPSPVNHVATPTTAPVADKQKIVVNFDTPKTENAAVAATNAAKPKTAPQQLPQTPQGHASQLETFMAPLWRRVAVAVLALLFLATLVSMYRFGRKQSAAVPNGSSSPGIGLPSLGIGGKQIEVLTDGLNVRQGPGREFGSLGVVLKGSKHKLLKSSDNGWVQIEVSEWSPNDPHVTDQKQGWVNGDPKLKLIDVSSRGLW